MPQNRSNYTMMLQARTAKKGILIRVKKPYLVDSFRAQSEGGFVFEQVGRLGTGWYVEL